MPDPNPPDDGTRKRSITAPPPGGIPPSAPTGEWTPADNAPAQLAVPTRIGRFEIRNVLGIGTYGRVFLAFDPEMGRLVAIKQPYGEGLKPEYRADFLKEARAAAVIDQHANVCPVYNVDTEGDLPYIVMRFVAGGTLKGMLERRSAPLPVRTALLIARKIALGLTAAHAKGVIHRDLKPGNVLIDDANREVLITDFGLARVTTRAAAAASMARGAHGTPYYMPPEQWGSKAFGEITPVADVYSLGIILYEMLTGRVPFSGAPFELMTKHCMEPPQSPSSVRPGLDPLLDLLVLKAIAKQPRDRYRSAQELADTLNDYLRGADVELVEELPLGEPIEEAPAPPPARSGSGRPAPPPLPKRPPTASPAASTASQPDATIEGKEVIRCPKCRARLEIAVGRTKPVDCPLCELKFAVAAGRQAAARGTEAEVEPLPLPPPPPPERKTRRVRAERRESLDDGPPRHHWLPAARGLRLALIGLLITGFFSVGVGIAGLAALGQESSSSSSSSSSNSSRGRDLEGFSSSELEGYRLAYGVLGLGAALGLLVTAIGRYQAGRLPADVPGSVVATLGAVAQFAAAGCVAIACVLIPWFMNESSSSTRSNSAALGAGVIAGGVAILLLLASDFAYTSYLGAIARHIGRGFPRGLTTATKVMLWIMLSCAIIGGVAGGIAAAMDETRSSGSKAPTGAVFFGVLAGASACLSMIVVPLWGLLMLLLNIRAMMAVGAYAHDEE